MEESLVSKLLWKLMRRSFPPKQVVRRLAAEHHVGADAIRAALRRLAYTGTVVKDEGRWGVTRESTRSPAEIVKAIVEANIKSDRDLLEPQVFAHTFNVDLFVAMAALDEFGVSVGQPAGDAGEPPVYGIRMDSRGVLVRMPGLPPIMVGRTDQGHPVLTYRSEGQDYQRRVGSAGERVFRGLAAWRWAPVMAALGRLYVPDMFPGAAIVLARVDWPTTPDVRRDNEVWLCGNPAGAWWDLTWRERGRRGETEKRGRVNITANPEGADKIVVTPLLPDGTVDGARRRVMDPEIPSRRLAAVARKASAGELATLVELVRRARGRSD